MFNWVGNKIKYIDLIKIYSEDFDSIIDPMMGSGNHLIELANKKNIIGSDVIKLMPSIYQNFNKFNIDIDSFHFVDSKWNNFICKNNYYEFRYYWNKKYLNDDFDKYFLIETFLLLKMCSNSMVRFNFNGAFNQGFRGERIENNIHVPFFTKNKFLKFIIELNYIKSIINNNLYKEFFHGDVLDTLNNIKFNNKTLFIFDPPYILETQAYCNNSYNKEYDKDIFNFIVDNNINFIYFNFLKRNGIIYQELLDFINNNKFEYVQLNKKSNAGQNRKNTSIITEILVSNIKKLDNTFF